jgi:hypothetical protein
MTYIEMVKAVRILCGMQGTGPASVEGAQGIEEVLAIAVRDAWVDVQNMRDEWDFALMARSFSTTAGKTNYTLQEIFSTQNPSFRGYKSSSFIITDSDGKKSYLQELGEDVMEARYLNSTSSALPSFYSIHYDDNEVELREKPDGVYTVSFKYWRAPEILTTSTQTPSLPQQYHQLIVYKAVGKMAIYLNNPETYNMYAMEEAKMMGQLMRGELRPKQMKIRPLV